MQAQGCICQIRSTPDMGSVRAPDEWLHRSSWRKCPLLQNTLENLPYTRRHTAKLTESPIAAPSRRAAGTLLQVLPDEAFLQA